MINYIPPASVRASGVNEGGGALNGIDLLTGIQILMVQDYDDQLKTLGKQIKGTTRVKKMFRQEMEQLQKYLMRRTEKKNDKESILLNMSEYGGINTTKDFVFDMQSNDVRRYTSTATGDERIDVTGTAYRTENVYNPRTRRTEQRRVETGKWVSKDAIEKKIENYKLKLDSLNEQSELMSLSLQSLTNQRKIAFETISNLVNKEQEGVAAIVRNIKS